MTVSPLWNALKSFRAEVDKLPRTKVGQIQNRTYRYAALDDILPVVEPLLAKHGLIWTCKPGVADDNCPILWFRLLHIESGENDEGVLRLGLGPVFKMQEFGSALTYARRYAMSAQLGLVTEEDDDGAASEHPVFAADHTKTLPRAEAESAKPTEPTAAAAQRRKINLEAGKKGMPSIDLAHAVQRVMGKPERRYANDVAAERHLAAMLDRFPSSKVTALLKEIERYGS